MDGHHLAKLDVTSLADGDKPKRVDGEEGIRLGLLQVLPVVLMSIGELPKRILGSLPGVVWLEEDGGPGLGQQDVRPLGVLLNLRKELLFSNFIPL